MTILILNGTSSSGKTTLSRAIQETMDDPYLDAGLDKFLWMLPRPYLNSADLWARVMTPTESGPIGMALIAGIHRSIAALAGTGNHVVADHVLVDPRWLNDCAATLADLPAHFIAVRCPLDVVEQRERERKDRTLGQARAQFDLVHAHGVYDFEVDTSVGSAEECAQQIKNYLAGNPTPTAFSSLRDG